MFERLKLRYRILLGYSIPVALSLLVAVLVYISAIGVAKQVEIAETKYLLVLEAAQAEVNSSAMARAVRGYLLIRDDSFLQSYEEGERDFDKNISRLKENVTEPSQRELIGKMTEKKNELKTYQKGLIALVKEGNQPLAVTRFRTGEVTRLYRELSEVIVAFEKRENDILTGTKKAVADALRFLTLVVWTGALLSAILAIIIGLFIASRIARSVTDAVNAISSTSTEISATVEQHERSAAQQAASVNETTSTMEELGTSSRQSAEQAEIAAAVSQKASTLTAEGGETVKEAMDGMMKMKEKVEAVAEQILRLSEQTTQIGNIANVVKDLAGQTNMLALNAAVEAARAGEQGKGFAVVAAEIRKLADQSKKSAEQANLIIADIQKATNATVMVTEEGTKTVESVTQLAHKVEEAFTALSTSAAGIYENAQQVMLNAKQQAEAIKQVVEAMNSISAGSKDTAAGISQTRVGIQKLDETAQNLKGMV